MWQIEGRKEIEILSNQRTKLIIGETSDTLRCNVARKKSLDLFIVSELLKNAKRSDRALAKKLGVSQPTVTRRRAKVEKELVDGYTAIPRWHKLGYEILAFTFVKTRSLLGPKEGIGL